MADGILEIKKSEVVKIMDIDPINLSEDKLFNFDALYAGAAETIEGFLLEGVIGGLTNANESTLIRAAILTFLLLLVR